MSLRRVGSGRSSIEEDRWRPRFERTASRAGAVLQIKAIPHPIRNSANITEPAEAILAGVASKPDAGRSSRIEGMKTSAKMNKSTPSITQPSQQPRNPIFCCLVNRERGRSSQPSDQVKLSRRDAARRGCFDIAGCLERGTYGQEWLETDRRLNACDGARRSVAALHRSRIRDAGTAGSTSAAGTSEPLSKARSWRTCVLSLSRSPSLNFGRPNTLPAARASGRTTTSSEIPKYLTPRTTSARPSGQAQAFEAAGRRSFAPSAVRDHHRAG